MTTDAPKQLEPGTENYIGVITYLPGHYHVKEQASTYETIAVCLAPVFKGDAASWLLPGVGTRCPQPIFLRRWEIGPRILPLSTPGRREAELNVISAARSLYEVERLHEEAAIRGGMLLELGRCLTALDAMPTPSEPDEALRMKGEG